METGLEFYLEEDGFEKKQCFTKETKNDSTFVVVIRFTSNTVLQVEKIDFEFVVTRLDGTPIAKEDEKKEYIKAMDRRIVDGNVWKIDAKMVGGTQNSLARYYVVADVTLVGVKKTLTIPQQHYICITLYIFINMYI